MRRCIVEASSLFRRILLNETKHLCQERKREIGMLQKTGQDLQRWVELHQVEEKAVTTFRNYLHEYQRVEAEDFALLFPDFSEEHVVIGAKEVSFTAPSPWTGDFCYVAVHFPVFYTNTTRECFTSCMISRVTT